MTSAGPHDGREPAAGGSSRLRASIAVGGVLVLLAVVAAASGAGSPLTGRDSVRDVPNLLVDYSYTLAIVLGVAILLGAIAALTQARKVPISAGGNQSAFLLGFFVLLLVAVFGYRAFRDFEPRATEDEAVVIPRLTEPQATTAPESERRRSPEFRWELALVAVVVAAAAIAYALRRLRSEDEEAEPGDAAEAVSLVLDEALDDLRAERDARRAVIAAYARLEATLARHGLPRRPAEAPLEYLSRILLELEVAPGAVLDLTDLFEQAKFSRRRIDEAMKDEAIDALVAVRDDLRVAA